MIVGSLPTMDVILNKMCNDFGGCCLVTNLMSNKQLLMIYCKRMNHDFYHLGLVQVIKLKIVLLYFVIEFKNIIKYSILS